MRRTCKPRASTAGKRSSKAFARAAAFRRVVIERGGRFVGYDWALLKTPSRSAAPYNVALRLKDGKVHARALTPGHDLHRLRATLAAMGFTPASVRAATDTVRRNLLNAFMLSGPPALPSLTARDKQGARIKFSGGAAVEIALGIERRNASNCPPPAKAISSEGRGSGTR